MSTEALSTKKSNYWNGLKTAETNVITFPADHNCVAYSPATIANCATRDPNSDDCKTCDSGYSLNGGTECKKDPTPIAGCSTYTTAGKCATCLDNLEYYNKGAVTGFTQSPDAAGDNCLKRASPVSIANCAKETQETDATKRTCITPSKNFYIDYITSPLGKVCTAVPNQNIPNCDTYEFKFGSDGKFTECSTCASNATLISPKNTFPIVYSQLSTHYSLDTSSEAVQTCVPFSRCSTRNYHGTCTGCSSSAGFYAMGAGRMLSTEAASVSGHATFEQLCSNTTLPLSSTIMSTLGFALIMLTL